MNTQLDPSFLRSLVMVCGFRGGALESAEAALLMVALAQGSASGADLPRELAVDSKGEPSKHIAGCACAALQTMGLFEYMGRIKSPREEAKGRKLNLYRVPPDKRTVARNWLRNRGYPEPQGEIQLSLLTA